MHAKNWQVRQLTYDNKNHELDHNENFSPDDIWIVYDTRKDPAGIGTNSRIEKVHVLTGEQRLLYQTDNPTEYGPGVGAASYHPFKNQVIFIHGLQNSNQIQPYAGHRRTGLILDENDPNHPVFMDARDIQPPFTKGALRGGTHRHQWSADGNWIGFTYNDAIMVDLERQTGKTHDLRTVGVANKNLGPVSVKKEANGENIHGKWFSVLAVKVTEDPQAGSEQISRAYGDWWVGDKGYQKPDGTFQRARAFMGDMIRKDGFPFTEVFVVDIPEDIRIPGNEGKLEGDDVTMPIPPKGAKQRRLTYLENNKYPGIALEPRHWLSSSSDGKYISYLAKDDAGIVQVFLVSPVNGKILQVTFHDSPVQSMVRWHRNGRLISYIWDNSIFICTLGEDRISSPVRITAKSSHPPFAHCWSREGDKIAFNQYAENEDGNFIQIFLAENRD